MSATPLDHLFVFIMAGGSGERFWPMSRTKTPKHLLRLLGDKTLLETTVRRLEGVVPWKRVFILTNAEQADAARAELSFLPAENIIAEPAKRDTAPACALATGLALAKDKKAVCALLPADAMIHNVVQFRHQLGSACETAARNEALVVFTIPPTSPSTAYGYLHLGEEAAPPAVRVLRFVEKPDLPTAQSYLQSGQYGWNAGMFVWRAEVFLNECARQSPPLADFIRTFPPSGHEAHLAEKFSALPKISVDYAIMEQAGEVLALKALFDWDDVGSWTALPGHLGHDDDGNTLRGEVAAVESRNTVAISNGRVIALCGVENLVVVETPDAVLVCHRDHAQNIKKLQPLLKDAVR